MAIDELYADVTNRFAAEGQTTGVALAPGSLQSLGTRLSVDEAGNYAMSVRHVNGVNTELQNDNPGFNPGLGVTPSGV